MFQYEDLLKMMQRINCLFCIICTSLILILAIIDFGVSISILVKFHDYGNIFQPEIGLAAFNIVISIYGMIIGGFGLFAVLTDRGLLSTYIFFFLLGIIICIYKYDNYFCFSR
jgi:hypothetical protein